MGSRHLKRLERTLHAQSSSDLEGEEEEDSPVQQVKNPFAFLQAEEGSDKEEPEREDLASTSTNQKEQAPQKPGKRSQKEEKIRKNVTKGEGENLDELLESMNINIVSCSPD